MSTRQVTVYLDLKSPYAYLAKDPAYDLARDYDCEVRLLPLTLEIPQFLGTVEGRNPHQWRRVRYSYMDARRYANRRGLTVYGPKKVYDSGPVHIAWLYAAGQGRDRAFLDLAFERFWRRELDIEAPEALEAALGEAGCTTEGFRDYLAGAGVAALRRVQEEAEAAGVFGVPTFVVDGEVYWGQDRLPLVLEHLEPRPRRFPAGAAPAVTAWIDLKSPYSYLATLDAFDLEEALGCTFRWRPYTLDLASMGVSAAPDARIQRKLRYMYMDVRRAAAGRGLTVLGPRRIFDSTAVNTAMLLAERQGVLRPYLLLAFDRFFRRELDLEDRGALATLLAEAGGDGSALAAVLDGEGRALHDASVADAEAAGAFGVPSFLLDGELFWGHDRLPALRQKLEARLSAGAPRPAGAQA